MSTKTVTLTISDAAATSILNFVASDLEVGMFPEMVVALNEVAHAYATIHFAPKNYAPGHCGDPQFRIRDTEPVGVPQDDSIVWDAIENDGRRWDEEPAI